MGTAQIRGPMEPGASQRPESPRAARAGQGARLGAKGKDLKFDVPWVLRRLMTPICAWGDWSGGNPASPPKGAVSRAAT